MLIEVLIDSRENKLKTFFDNYQFKDKKQTPEIIFKPLDIGDIIINLNKIKNKNIKKSFRIEFDRLWIHGFVHLFGHDHKKKEDFTKMARVENKYFNIINV